MVVGGQGHVPAASPPGKRAGTHRIGGWVGPGSVWTGVENLANVQPLASRYTG
jgi:hypothetical protein